MPDAPRAALVFYHGGGAHSGAGYPHLAQGLRDDFGIATYTPDLRGHGASGGARGDAPEPAQLWRDIRSLVAFVRAQHPGLPLFLGGHSSGAGVSLNYASWSERDPVDGYVFLSPQLGHRSDTARPQDPSDPRPAFAQARIAPFVVNGISGGRLMGHTRAVRFRYPPELLEADPGMVAFNTVHFANGLTPREPTKQFEGIDRPFGLWIGQDDEIFDPDRVVAYGILARHVRDRSHSSVVPDRNHLGILVDAHTWVGRFLDQRLSER